MKTRATSFAIYSLISLAAPAILSVACYWIYNVIMSVYAETMGRTLDGYWVHHFVFFILLTVAVALLLVLEVIAAVQLLRNGKSRIPLVGRIATIILTR